MMKEATKIELQFRGYQPQTLQFPLAEPKFELNEVVEREVVETGCYSAPDPRTRFQKLRDRLFPSKHCFAPESPEEFEDCIHGKATTHLSFVDRLRVLFTGVVITQWRTVTEHKPGRTISAATCHIGTAKDLMILLVVMLCAC